MANIRLDTPEKSAKVLADLLATMEGRLEANPRAPALWTRPCPW